MTNKILAGLLATLSITCFAATAEQTMIESLSKKYPATRFNSVKKTPIEGVWEVVMGGGDITGYTDKTGRYFLLGDLYDMKTQTNLTNQSTGWTNYKDNAIKFVKGNGKRELAVFSDPNCPWCQKLEATLENLDDVTIYVFLLPVLGQGSVTKATEIWCADNKKDAWKNWMLKQQSTPAKECQTPFERNKSLASFLGIKGTPAMVSKSGKVLPGYVTIEKVEELLNAE